MQRSTGHADEPLWRWTPSHGRPVHRRPDQCACAHPPPSPSLQPAIPLIITSQHNKKNPAPIIMRRRPKRATQISPRPATDARKHRKPLHPGASNPDSPISKRSCPPRPRPLAACSPLDTSVFALILHSANSGIAPQARAGTGSLLRTLLIRLSDVGTASAGMPSLQYSIGDA